MAQNDLFALIVQARPVKKQPLLIWLLNRPTGEATRDLLHVFLRVAAVHAHRVQLHQLARVVLIQTTIDPGRFILGRRIWACNTRPPVVQIEQHRGRMRGRAQQVAESSEREGANCVAIKARQQVTIRILVGENAKVVLPEINHHFVQLTFAVNGAQQCGALQFGNNHLRILWWRRWLRRRRFGLRSVGLLRVRRLLHFLRTGLLAVRRSL